MTRKSLLVIPLRAKELGVTAQRIVIVGAGIAGTGLADELALRGHTNITVIDQGPLFKTGGASSHAPGLMTRTSPSQMMLGLADYTIEKLLTMNHDGLPCFYDVGAIEIATTPARLDYLKRRVEFAQSWGFSGRLIDPQEAAQQNPLLDPASILGGYATTREGIGKALRGAQAQGERAQHAGVKFLGDTRVLSVAVANDRVTGVLTNDGLIPADLVILAAGSWGRGLALSAGVTLPMVAMEHQYAITSAVDVIAAHRDFDTSLPFIRHWDGGVYMRNEGDRVGIGSFNHKALPLSDDVIVNGNERRFDPSMFEFTQEDWDPAWEDVVAVMPVLRDATLELKYNGVFPYTPDGLPLLGPTALDGLWALECVWATHAVGAARSLAELISGEEPTVDITTADIARFDTPELSRNDFEIRCDNSYVDTYAIHHPAEPSASPRGVRRSAFYGSQEKLGAAFFDTSAWERPRWYDCNADRVSMLSIPERDEWSSRYWSPISAAEHVMTRQSVGIFDMTSLRRILVTGPDASTFLNRIAARNVDGPIGSVVYTLLLTEHGRIVSDVTISRLGENRYLVGGNSARDELWLKAHSMDFTVTIAEVTASTSCLAVWGPQSRAVLEALTDCDLSNETFRYFTAQEIEVAGVPVTAVRVSYVGELGWELTANNDIAARLWDQVIAQAQERGGGPAGRGALTSLRIEKGYRSWGTDMTRADTPLEAGLDFAVRADGNHVGVSAARATLARRQLVTLRLDSNLVVPVFGNPVFQNGRAIGSVTSAEFGWSVGAPLAYAWLPSDLSIQESVVIHAGGAQISAQIVPPSQWDPTGARLRN